MAYSDKTRIREIQWKVGTEDDGIWGPKTLKAVCSKLGCQDTVVALLKHIGVTADGIVGPNTIRAILDKLDIDEIHCVKHIFIDAGHTRDYNREHPSLFCDTDWKCGKPREILSILGMSRDANDSIEHRLNLIISQRLLDELRKKGYDVTLYDAPELSNNAEIRQVYTRSNALRPDAFISIHNNAQGGSKWKSLGGTASGPVGLYNTKSSDNKRLAMNVVDSEIAYRKEADGPNNRASKLATSTVGVLSNALPSIPACLIEVGFYDNIDDLYWMCTHLNGLAASLARGIDYFFNK